MDIVSYGLAHAIRRGAIRLLDVEASKPNEMIPVVGNSQQAVYTPHHQTAKRYTLAVSNDASSVRDVSNVMTASTAGKRVKAMVRRAGIAANRRGRVDVCGAGSPDTDVHNGVTASGLYSLAVFAVLELGVA